MGCSYSFGLSNLDLLSSFDHVSALADFTTIFDRVKNQKMILNFAFRGIDQTSNVFFEIVMSKNYDSLQNRLVFKTVQD